MNSKVKQYHLAHESKNMVATVQTFQFKSGKKYFIRHFYFLCLRMFLLYLQNCISLVVTLKNHIIWMTLYFQLSSRARLLIARCRIINYYVLVVRGVITRSFSSIFCQNIDIKRKLCGSFVLHKLENSIKHIVT